MNLLKMENVSRYFGGLAAVSGLDLELRTGEILGLIGPNGAGKTTVFNLINGVYSPNMGRILFEGEDITGLKPHKIASKGLARTFQISTFFKKCSVLENVVMGYHFQKKAGPWSILWRTKLFRQEEQEIIQRSSKLLEVVNLTHYKDVLAGNLSHGHQRRLAIVIALATEPKLLLLDEPFSGMDSEETKEMMNLIRQICDKGTTVFLIEHDMKAVMGLCERIVVLNYGKKLAEGAPQEIQENRGVIEAYLGRHDDFA